MNFKGLLSSGKSTTNYTLKKKLHTEAERCIVRFWLQTD